LIEQGEDKVLHSSGISVTLANHFENRANWDNTARHVWENLTRHYPAYFSDNDKELSKANLNLLSNLSEIERRLETVKNKKDDLLNQQVQNYIESNFNALNSYRKALINFVDSENDKVSNSDVNELRENKVQLEKSSREAKGELELEFEDLIKDLKNNIRKELERILDTHFKQTKSNIDDSKGTKEESYTTGWWFWKKTHYNTVSTVNTGMIKNALEELTYKIQKEIDAKAEELAKDWKNNLTNSILKTLRNCVDDQDLEIVIIKRAIQIAIYSVEYPELDYSVIYSERINKILNKTGALKGTEAEEFIEKTDKFVLDFRKRIAKDIKDYSETLSKTLKEIDISDKIFSSYFERIDALEQQINSKEITLDKLSRIKKELQEIDESYSTEH